MLAFRVCFLRRRGSIIFTFAIKNPLKYLFQPFYLVSFRFDPICFNDKYKNSVGNASSCKLS